MQDIISTNYQSIVDRGFITPTTTLFEFLDKLDEEVEETSEDRKLITEVAHGAIPAPFPGATCHRTQWNDVVSGYLLGMRQSSLCSSDTHVSLSSA